MAKHNDDIPKSSMNCYWREDEDGNWLTDCGRAFVVAEGNPRDNHMHYCCYCGAKLRQRSYRGK